MYVRYYEDKMRIPDDNPTIGIILCSEKDEAVVKYSFWKIASNFLRQNINCICPQKKNWRENLKEK